MWYDIKEYPIPTDRDFLAAWIDPEACIEGIEWYGAVDVENQIFMNLNSNNQNELGKKAGYPMFTHWTEVPKYEEGPVA